MPCVAVVLSWCSVSPFPLLLCTRHMQRIYQEPVSLVDLNTINNGLDRVTMALLTGSAGLKTGFAHPSNRDVTGQPGMAQPPFVMTNHLNDPIHWYISMHTGV